MSEKFRSFFILNDLKCFLEDCGLRVWHDVDPVWGHESIIESIIEEMNDPEMLDFLFCECGVTDRARTYFPEFEEIMGFKL